MTSCISELADRIRFKIGHKTIVSPARLRRERGALSLTFDDFPRSAWREGGAVLAHHGVRGTYFPSGSLCSSRYLSIDQFTSNDLEEVASAGHEVGSHGFDHTSVLRQSVRDFSKSISKNSDFIKGILPNIKLDSFAYPYGNVSLSAKFKVSSSFKFGRGLGDNYNCGWMDLSQMKAVGLEKSKRGLHDFPALLESAALNKGWLIIYTHDVGRNPSDWGCTEDEIDNLIKNAKAAGLDILPMNKVRYSNPRYF